MLQVPCGAEDGQRDAAGRLIETIKEQRSARGNASKETLAAWRQCWGCDCDGVSHATGGYKSSGVHKSIKQIGGHIKSLTGQAPPACPWRALWDPLVRDVISIVNKADEGVAQPELLDPDAPAILTDAVDVFVRARRSVRAHYEEQIRKKHEREMEQQRSKTQRPRRR